MAISESVESLNDKVDQLIVAYKQQLSNNRVLIEKNEALQKELKELKENSVPVNESASDHEREQLKSRIDELVTEVDRCMELLDK